MLRGQKSKLKKELKEFHESLKNESRWTIVEKDEDTVDSINVLIFGPPKTPYEGGTFEVEIEFPRKYPLEAPELEMKTKIFHPMINKSGNICLSILGDWDHKNKGHKFINCLEKIYDALEKPQDKDYLAEAINDEALCLCVDNFKQFETQAREYTEKFGMIEDDIRLEVFIEWKKGVRIAIKNDKGIEDEYPFEKDLIEGLKEYDGLAFLKCMNKIEWCIDQTIKKHAGNSPLDTIVTLSGGTGYCRKGGWPYARNNNNNNNNNNNQNNNNNNNDNNNNNGRNNGSQNNNGNNNSGNNGNNGNNNNGDNGDNEDEANENDQKSQRTSDKTDVEISRKIAFHRGLDQCSGDCGNTVIRACHLFYDLLLTGELDCKKFNENADTIHDQENMWNLLLDAFINHDDRGNENEELLIDLMYFIKSMSQTVKAKNFDPFETETWPNNRQGTVFETIARLMERMGEAQRKQRVLCCSRALIAEFKKYEPNQNNSDSKSEEKENNNNNENYGLNQFLRAACHHQLILKEKEKIKRGIESEIQSMLVHVNTSVSLPTTENLQAEGKNEEASRMHIDNETTVKITNKIIKAVQKKFTLELMLRMAQREDGSMAMPADFNILQLIILTSKFVVEHQTGETFNLDVPCIDGDRYLISNLIKQEEYQNMPEIKNLVPVCKELYKHPRNIDINEQEKLLTEEMIAAIRFYCIPGVMKEILKYQLQGKTCEYRNVCKLKSQGLERLKEYDSGFDIVSYSKKSGGLYCKKTDVLHCKNRKTSGIFGPANFIDCYGAIFLHEEEYKSDPNVDTLHQLMVSSLPDTPGVFYGDVSWMIRYGSDDEKLQAKVLVDACILDQLKVHPNDESMKKVKVMVRGRKQVGALVEKYQDSDEYVQVVKKKQQMKANGGTDSVRNSSAIIRTN